MSVRTPQSVANMTRSLLTRIPCQRTSGGKLIQAQVRSAPQFNPSIKMPCNGPRGGRGRVTALSRVLPTSSSIAGSTGSSARFPPYLCVSLTRRLFLYSTEVDVVVGLEMVSEQRCQWDSRQRRI